jgi:hypothetical protein
MRQDQYEKLQALAEKLTDVFLEEADSDKWPGTGIESRQMDQQTRGDRYWCKKNAAATLTVIMKTANLVGVIQQRSAGGGDGGAAVSEAEREADTLDADIKAAEKEATKLLNKMQKGAHRKAHGKS